VVDFINEVEEELRKDDYNELLRRYGPYILGITIAIILIAGFMEWRKSAADTSARATSAAYVTASNEAVDGDKAKALAQFIKLSEIAPDGYAGLSLMRAAALELDAGRRGESIRLYDQAAARFTQPRHIQLAQIKAAYILANDAAYNDVITRVSPLAEKDMPYEYLARELLAFAALETGDTAKARQQFAFLESIPGVPPSIQARAAQSLSLMAVDAAAAAQLLPKDNDAETPQLIPNSAEDQTNE